MLQVPPLPESPVLLAIAAMPLLKRAMALSTATYPYNSELARTLVTSVAEVEIWGPAAKRRWEFLQIEADKDRRRRAPRKPGKAPKLLSSVNLFRDFAPDEDSRASGDDGLVAPDSN